MKERLKKYVADVLFRAMLDGLSVEDLLDSMEGAVREMLRVAEGQRDLRYRKELKLFYGEIMELISGMRRQVEKAGHVAKAMAGG